MLFKITLDKKVVVFCIQTSIRIKITEHINLYIYNTKTYTEPLSHTINKYNLGHLCLCVGLHDTISRQDLYDHKSVKLGITDEHIQSMW